MERIILCSTIVLNGNFRVNYFFQSELFLEDFIWHNLESLLKLKRLARQYYLNNQICDILAIAWNKQLTVIELKNTEDRYIIQQLTRYYDAVRKYRPFSEQVDYQLPIRLIAIAPCFHQHNLIDLEYNKLTVKLLNFRINHTEDDKFCFELKDIENQAVAKLNIPEKFHQFLFQTDEKVIELTAKQLPPPKSLLKLMESLSSEQKAYVLNIRDRLLSYDERIREKGFTTRTVYGLAKGNRDIYKTKLCAEFIPDTYGFGQLRLRLRLPYPKRELIGKGITFYKDKPVKGLTWVEIRHEKLGHKTTAIKLLFYLGKRRSYSYACDLDEYATLYQQLTEQNLQKRSLDGLLIVALEEWKLLLSKM